jgi:hypothetical protein
VFVTSHGTAHGRFQGAIEQRNVLQAEMAARELEHVTLRDALKLVVLYADEGSPKFEPAALRWLARLALEGRDLRVVELQLAGAALLNLRGLRRDRAEKTLLGLL